jgi:hypothetical protein
MFALPFGPEREYPSDGTSRLPSRALKKYFRDPAKRRDPFPISGIFATGWDLRATGSIEPLMLALLQNRGQPTPTPSPDVTQKTPLAPVAGNMASNHAGGFPAPKQAKKLERTGLADVSEADAASRKSRFLRGHGIF